jgi:hypothetical protein
MFGASLSSVLALAVGFGSGIVLVILAIVDLRTVARLRAARTARGAGTLDAAAAVGDRALAVDSRGPDEPLAA